MAHSRAAVQNGWLRYHDHISRWLLDELQAKQQDTKLERTVIPP